MYSLTVENIYKQKMELTHNDSYVIESIEGIDPPDATINTTRNANIDGSVFNSAYVNNRQIIITLAINGPAEANRIKLYKYFKSKYPVKLYYKNDTRDVYIEGYCKKPQIEFFNIKQIAQITIICTEPFFNGAVQKLVNYSSINPLFEFPFSVEDPPGEIEFGEILTEEEKDIINDGDVETGVEIFMRARGPVINPTVYKSDDNKFFKLNMTMAKGDEIYINTNKNHKTVELTHNGMVSKIISNLAENSTWFSLTPGDNLFMITATNGAENIEAYCLLTDKYEGV